MQKILSNASSLNHKERLLKLSEKISEVRIYTPQEKHNRLRTLEQTVEYLEESAFECQETFTKALKGLEDNICALQNEVDEDIKEANTLISNDLQDLLKFEQKLQSTYENICQRRKEHETCINQFLDEKITALSADVKTEISQMQEGVKQLTQIYQADIKNLNNALSQVKADRQSEDDKIENFMRTNVSKISDDNEELQKHSEISEKTLFNSIKNSIVEFKGLLDTERSTRETTHEQMIERLEDSYSSFRSYNV